MESLNKEPKGSGKGLGAKVVRGKAARSAANSIKLRGAALVVYTNRERETGTGTGHKRRSRLALFPLPVSQTRSSRDSELEEATGRKSDFLTRAIREFLLRPSSILCFTDCFVAIRKTAKCECICIYVLKQTNWRATLCNSITNNTARTRHYFKSSSKSKIVFHNSLKKLKSISFVL